MPVAGFPRYRQRTSGRCLRRSRLEDMQAFCVPMPVQDNQSATNLQRARPHAPSAWYRASVAMRLPTLTHRPAPAADMPSRVISSPLRLRR
jgi:hypothetical protein